jgi:cob(I)alamin adenosyltransferase
MKLYTKTGDSGTTSLYDGSRVEKTNIVFDVLGLNDELSSHIGLLIAHLDKMDMDLESHLISQLRNIQANLQYINSIIATPDINKQKKLKHINDTHISEIESWIDFMEKFNPKLTSFILPGVTIEDAQAHICRTSCRKAEREVIKYSKIESFEVSPDILKYMNRLSDYFFSLARYICNILNNKEDYKIKL